MTPWLGFPGSRVPEGLVTAWGHTGRQGSTPGPPDPVRKAQPQTHRAQYPHRPAEPAPPRRHPGDTGPPESIRQVPVRRGREQSSAGGRLSGPAPSQVLTSCIPDFVLFEILLTLSSLTPSFRKSPWMASASACHPLGGDGGRNRWEGQSGKTGVCEEGLEAGRQDSADVCILCLSRWLGPPGVV